VSSSKRRRLKPAATESDAKILGPDGREFSLADLRKGQMLRVTTRDPDPMTAVLVEILKAPAKDKAPDGK